MDDCSRFNELVDVYEVEFIKFHEEGLVGCFLYGVYTFMKSL